MSDDDDKIVSLDQRRREDQARQKAELAAAAAAKRKTNGSGRDLSKPFGRPMGSGGAGASSPRTGGAIGRLVGTVAAGAVWGGLAAMIAIAVWSAMAG